MRDIVASARTRLLVAVTAVVTLAGVLYAFPASTSVAETETGAPRFQVDPLWPKPLPNDWELGQVGGIDVDQHDRIWIVQRRSGVPPVMAFDVEGNLLKSWGGPGDGYDWPSGEHGIWVDHNNNVWIGGNGGLDHQVLKFTENGDFLLQIGQAGLTGGSNNTSLLGNPADGDVDPEANEVYIADGYRNRRVIVFDADTGEYKRHWGAYGDIPLDAPLATMQFGNPVHCAVLADDGLLYVCDRVNNRVQVFQKDGTFVSEFDVGAGTLGNGAVWDVDFSADEPQTFLYVPDGENRRLWIVDRARQEILSFFGEPGFEPGQFDWVHNASTDSRGNIYTAEVNQGERAQKFTLVDPGTVPVERLAGPARVDTAVAVSRRAYQGAETVVLARQDDYADALTGAPLAASLRAPILLTGTDRLPEATAAEIGRLRARQAILLGGRTAISDAVAAQLRELGLEVQRIGGQTRYATAALIADRLGASSSAFVAEGQHAQPDRGWPDALSTAPYAAFTQRPILLVTRDSIPPETAAALEGRAVTETIVVGGAGAVSERVFNEIRDAGHGPRRLAGSDRYATSKAVFDDGIAAGMSPNVTWLATGLDWPDSLAAAPVVGARGHAFLLVHGRNLGDSPATAQALRDRRTEILAVRLLGGTAAISAVVEGQIRATLANSGTTAGSTSSAADAGLIVAGMAMLPLAALLRLRRRGDA